MIKLLLLCLLFQGNPTYLLQTKNLTIFTEVKEEITYITITEVQDNKTRVACHKVLKIKPMADGIQFEMCGSQRIFIPNNKEQMGLISEQSEKGMTAIVFDKYGIIFSGLMDQLLKEWKQ